VLQAVWAWAHFGGDWELVRERWPLIKPLFIAPLSTGWVGFGPHGVVALGDDAAGALAFARLAYKAGDMDSYNYGCQMFARELAHHYAKQRGAKYFQDNQPYRSMEPIDGDVFLTSLHTDGWHIGGPKYPANAVEREFEKRWRRFHNEDVARFYRELLPVDVKRELDVLPLGSPGERRARNEPDALPSLVQLRSLLLNESPAQLASNAVPDKFTGSAGGVIANCLAILRASRPPRFERLIPGGEPSPFVAGIERDVAGPNVFLTQQVGAESNSSTRITWPVWKTPTGVAWNFGEVSVATNAPAVAEAIPLNWNSRVTSSP
jgi:hypothetical protein